MAIGVRKFLLRIVLLAHLFLAFLASNYIPSGITSVKELGLYFVTGGSAVASSLIWFLIGKAFRFHWIDAVVVSYLLFLPLLHYFLRNDVMLSVTAINIAFATGYLAVRILASSMHRAHAKYLWLEAVTYSLIFSILLAFIQERGWIASAYPGHVTGMFANPAPFAIHLAALTIVAMLSSGQNVQLKRISNSLLYGTFSVGALYFIITSMSRSAWLGLGGAVLGICFLTVFTIGTKAWTQRKVLHFLLISTLCVCVIVSIGFQLYSMKKDSADGRQLIWQSTLCMVHDVWLSGKGLGNFSAHYPGYQAEILEHPDASLHYDNLAGDIRYAFNDLLQIWAEAGVIGLILFGVILTGTLRCLIQCGRKEKSTILGRGIIYSLIGSLLVLSLSGLCSYPLQMIPIAALFWVTVAVSVSVYNANIESIKVHFGKECYLFGLTVLVMAVFIFHYGIVRLKGYLAWGQYIAGVQPLPLKDSAFDVLLDHPIYLHAVAKEARIQGKYGMAVYFLRKATDRSPYPGYYYELGQCYEQIGRVDSAWICYDKVQRSIPNLLRPRYLKARLYHRVGDTIRFQLATTEALGFQPKVVNPEVIAMQEELRQLRHELK